MSTPTPFIRITLTVREGRALLRSLITSRTPSADADDRLALDAGLSSKKEASDSNFKHTRQQSYLTSPIQFE
ncbi:hypothetical protein C8R44DRAFT_865142 [Mycena epipterygia]|nr:hypothetical protein C8R44DRAFT_865142 [Mycena epipterygia]